MIDLPTFIEDYPAGFIAFDILAMVAEDVAEGAFDPLDFKDGVTPEFQTLHETCDANEYIQDAFEAAHSNDPDIPMGVTNPEHLDLVNRVTDFVSAEMVATHALYPTIDDYMSAVMTALAGGRRPGAPRAIRVSGATTRVAWQLGITPSDLASGLAYHDLTMEQVMALTAERFAVTLTARRLEGETGRTHVFICESCRCLFWPEDDGEFIFADRATILDQQGSRCDDEETCICHTIPHRLPTHSTRLYRFLDAVKEAPDATHP